jgi:hypothetical protein
VAPIAKGGWHQLKKPPFGGARPVIPQQHCPSPKKPQQEEHENPPYQVEKPKRWVAPIKKGGWHQLEKPPEGAG